MKQILSYGAEATIYKNNDKILKERVKKSYRIREIDEKLRRFRTRRESKLLESLDFVPKVLDIDENNMVISMEFIPGHLIRDILDKLSKNERLKICKDIGKNIASSHSKDIVHGDLTTSNMILKDNKVFFVDFGLGLISRRVEDKAVDLHLLKRALEARHNTHYLESFEEILKSYKENYKEANDIIERLKKVESRGRYKQRIA